MKHLLLFLFLSSFLISFGQTQKIKAYLGNKQFCAPEVGNYIEIQLQFVGYSFKYLPVNEGLQGEVVVRMKIKTNDSIVAKDDYRLKTPVMKDSIIDDFFDLRRFALKPGSYVLDIELQDLNTEGESINASKQFTIEDLTKRVAISDIQVSESVTRGSETSIFFKSGYVMIPNLATFYPSEISKLPVYLEIYNSTQLGDSLIVLKQTIRNTITGKEFDKSTIITRHKVASIIPILRPVDISTIPSGNYLLEYAILKDTQEIAVKTFEFERSNDILDTYHPQLLLIDPAFQASITDDSVAYYLASLIPMSKPAEVKNILAILKNKNKESARKHIQSFWTVTSGMNAYDSWIRYKSQVQLVEKVYKTNFQAGYETDRGRVYLQYGAPTTILQKEVSSSEYPYEIWQYNKIGKFSNKRFIFYNPDLVNNSYRLLHSDMIGELKNSSWQLVLNKRNTNNGTIDDPNQNVEQNWGGNSNNNFKQY